MQPRGVQRAGLDLDRRVREGPARVDRFFVLPGHEDTSVESVVERSERYVVVQKIGDAAEEADDLDPRS